LVTEPPSEIFIITIQFLLISFAFLSTGIFLVILLIASGLMSGSEVAFFSLNRSDLDELEKEQSPASKRIIKLQEKPQHLLATILITNNFINIAIVIVSTVFIDQLIGPDLLDNWATQVYQVLPYFEVITYQKILDTSITIGLVTFLLVLFGEVAPKIYAKANNIRFASLMARPLSALCWFLNPVTNFMVRWSSAFEKKLGKISQNSSTSKEELEQAIELTVSQELESDDEVDILRGILKFGDVTTKQIMKSRVDVVGLDIETEYKEVLKIIKEHGYSRIPVYKEDFDNIEGILYVKDLIGFINNKKSIKWQKFIRKDVLYVPESKNIDELLKDFQKKRMHMGIVVDEFGGSAGLVTLEDIMEEVIGDIKDEFDEVEEVEYEKIDDSNYIFEGKTLLNDVARIMDMDTEVFDDLKGQSDSLAGLVLELLGDIPEKDTVYENERFRFNTIAVNKRRIEKIHLSILEKIEEDEADI